MEDESSRIRAVIVDLDGTLLDTERATRGVIKEFLATYGKVPDPEEEHKRLGQTGKESAAAIIADYGLPLTVDEFLQAIMPFYKEMWPHAKVLPGVNRLIKHLHKHGVPLGLASNSMRKNVDFKISIQKGWKNYFSVILGGDEVNQGKPSPDIYLEAAKRFGVGSSSCLVIEDSPVGVQAGKAAGATVVAIPSLQNQLQHYSIADTILNSLLEFHPELWGLPPFDDWVQDALPIETLHVTGQIGDVETNDLFSLTTDDESYDSIPDQVSGIFFGWVKLEMHGVSKVVVSMGWDLSSKTAQRVMKARIIGRPNDIRGEKFQLLLTGYIRRLQNKDNLLEALEINEKDEDTASNALDLPVFSQHA